MKVSALECSCLPAVEEVGLLSQPWCPLFLYKTWYRQVVSSLTGSVAGWLGLSLDWAEASVIWVPMIPRRTETCNFILAGVQVGRIMQRTE